jgi:outer membrane protein TolC
MALNTEIARLVVTLGLGFWVSMAALAAPPQPTGQDPEGPPAEEHVEDLVLEDQTSLESEREANALIRDAAARFGNRRLTELSIRKAALYSLRRSLDIQRRYVGEDVARWALHEVEAVFNPVLFLAFNYGHSETFTRIEHDQRFKPASQNQAVGTGNNPNRIAPIVTPQNPEQVDPRNPRIELTAPRAAGKVPSTIPASVAPVTGPINSYTYDARLDQVLPWGGNLTLAYKAVDQATFFINNPASFLSNQPGFTSAGSYNRPWVSSFLTNLVLPLPGSKEFGPYAEQSVAIKLADLNRERTFSLAESVINTALRDMEVNYWELLRTQLNLRVTIENRQGVEQLLARTQKLYDLRMATNYDKAQVEAELARLQSLEESAWNAYVVASNALVRLLNLEETQVLLPVGYTQTLAYALSEQQDLNILTSRGSTDNPDLAVASVDVKSARIDQERKAVRTRPDVRLVATVNSVQSNGVFGYQSLGDSINKTFDPDVLQQNYSLVYLYPWRNQAVKAQLNQAEAVTTRQELVVKQTDNSIYRDINNAQIALNSAGERVKITARNVELAELTYEKAVAQGELGLVGAYEIVQQNQRLLTARLDYIQAKTVRKQAEAQLLAALGVLPKSYAERTAQTALDRHRLNVLAANHVLRHFGDSP